MKASLRCSGSRWRRADASDKTLRDEIAPSVRGAATRELLAQIEIRRVSERFARERVRVLIFKGTALAYTACTSAWHRPRTDTDLLIHPDDAAEAMRVSNPVATRGAMP